MINHTNQILSQQVYDDLKEYTDKQELEKDNSRVLFIGRAWDEAKQDHITSFFGYGDQAHTANTFLKVMEVAAPIRDYILIAALRYLGENYSQENILELLDQAKKA